jgi:hypothetical protein
MGGIRRSKPECFGTDSINPKAGCKDQCPACAVAGGVLKCRGRTAVRPRAHRRVPLHYMPTTPLPAGWRALARHSVRYKTWDDGRSCCCPRRCPGCRGRIGPSWPSWVAAGRLRPHSGHSGSTPRGTRGGHSGGGTRGQLRTSYIAAPLSWASRFCKAESVFADASRRRMT